MYALNSTLNSVGGSGNIAISGWQNNLLDVLLLLLTVILSEPHERQRVAEKMGT